MWSYLCTYLGHSSEQDTLSAGGGDGHLFQLLEAPYGAAHLHFHQGGDVAAVRWLHLDGQLLDEDVTLHLQLNPVLGEEGREGERKGGREGGRGK